MSRLVALRPHMRTGVLVLGIGLYLVSLALPALDFRSTGSDPENIWFGWHLLVLGWLALLVGQVAWLANAFLAAALILIALDRWRPAAIISGIALLLGLTTVFFNHAGVPANEGGVGTLYIHHVLIGSYLWFAAIIVTLLGSVLASLLPAQDAPTPPLTAQTV